jgi:hypothetical protein
MGSEIIQSVAYDNFQYVNFIFSQNFIPLFWGLFNDETDLRVSYCLMSTISVFSAMPCVVRWKVWLTFSNKIEEI